MALAGAYKTRKKNGIVYYRSSFTFRNKHISLGSFSTENLANEAYNSALRLVSCFDTIDSYSKDYVFSFDKFVSIINFRDKHVYFKNPIYLENRYFLYYLSPSLVYKFDIDDLFYYASHKISRRNGHLFIADYGMQISLLSRYHIKSHAVLNRDYRFINGDCYDFRYENIEIINKYYGVTVFTHKSCQKYKARILINGTYTVGIYDTEEEAAIAYNKAADYVSKIFPSRHYQQNYIEGLSPSQYANTYTTVPISAKILSIKLNDES